MIDAPIAMVIVGAALQAVPPVERIVATLRRRRATADVVRSLPWTPLPRADAALDQLFDRAAAALDTL